MKTNLVFIALFGLTEGMHNKHRLSILYLAAMRLLFYFLIVVSSLLNLSAQIPVGEEPLHHILHEDEEIRVLEIIATPGDTALMHQHDYNYCYIATRGGRMWLEDYGKESREVKLPTHYAGGKFNLSEGPFTHRFANIGDNNIRFFTVEHKTGIARQSVSKPLPADNILESKLFTISKLNLAPLSSLKIPHKGTVILLNLAEDLLFISENQPLEYWALFERNESIYIQNMAQDTIPCAVFEIY